jgi:hypothetical protein
VTKWLADCLDHRALPRSATAAIPTCGNGSTSNTPQPGAFLTNNLLWVGDQESVLRLYEMFQTLKSLFNNFIFGRCSPQLGHYPEASLGLL